jgi:DNA-binding LacI/PurR family transcriptional regulator
VLFVSSHEDPEAEAGVPIVVVDRPIEGHPAVAADNRSGAGSRPNTC